MPDVEEVTREDVTTMPSTDESFNPGAVPVLLELVSDRLNEYVSQQVGDDEPVSLLGFAMELIYQTGAQHAVAERRARNRG